MATIENYVNLPSVADAKEILRKFPAFFTAPLSKKAYRQGAWEEYISPKCANGTYYTRGPVVEKGSRIFSVYGGGPLLNDLVSYCDFGLRVVLQLFYNPASTVVKDCKTKFRTGLIWDKENGKSIETSGEAPVVKYRGIEYLWLNKDECEAGSEKTMRLVSVECLARAESFDYYGRTNDYGSPAAERIRKQCEKEAFAKHATPEEEKLLAKVQLSEKDGYETATPILDKPPKTIDRDGKGGM